LVFKEIQENLWLFEFSEDSDKQKVLAGRPWTYNSTLLILNEFAARLHEQGDRVPNWEHPG